MSKYILYGITEYATRESEEGAEIIENRMPLAIFDDLDDAEEYVEKSKTAEYEEYYTLCYGGHAQFKTNSLLSDYLHAEIEEYYELPRNPVLN